MTNIKNPITSIEVGEHIIRDNNDLIPIDVVTRQSDYIPDKNIGPKINNPNILDILNNPTLKPFIKIGFEVLLKSIIKQKILASGSSYIANNIFELTEKKKFKTLIKRRTQGRINYDALMDYREKLIKDDFKKMVHKKMKNYF